LKEIEMMKSAKQVRQTSALRPWLLTLAFAFFANCAQADQAVYKCGQEITNQPLDLNVCQRLNTSQPTQIEGTRVQTNSKQERVVSSSVQSDLTPAAQLQATVTQAGSAHDSQDRKTQARTILEDELQKLSLQYAELVHLYNRGQPLILAGESIHQPSYQTRAQALYAQIQRTERDMQALQREINRYGKRMTTAISK
jgi:hypothetical protein